MRIYLAVYKNGQPIKDATGAFVVAPEGSSKKNWVFAVARDAGGKVVVLEETVRLVL